MTKTTHPSKEAVRQLMTQRREAREPPPSLEEIRRALGWNLIEAQRREQRGK